MNHDDSIHETGRGVLTGVLAIVLAGAALGVGFNALLVAGGPGRGLAWVRVERPIASLEELVARQDSLAAAPGAATATPPPPGAPAPTVTSQAVPPRAGAASASPPAAATPSAPEPASAAVPVPTATPPTAVPPAGAAASGVPGVAAPVIPDMREPLEVKFETVKTLWDANAAVFVDARTGAEYAAEHIARAVSLPLDDLPKKPDMVKSFDSGGRPIVVYCDGGECELSKNLAWNLVDAGQRKVLVYLGGIVEWKQRGGALATGAAPGGTR